MLAYRFCSGLFINPFKMMFLSRSQFVGRFLQIQGMYNSGIIIIIYSVFSLFVCVKVLKIWISCIQVTFTVCPPVFVITSLLSCHQCRKSSCFLDHHLILYMYKHGQNGVFYSMELRNKWTVRMDVNMFKEIIIIYVKSSRILMKIFYMYHC